MGNIVDYLSWRGDIPFEIDHFNRVDALILSELTYTDFSEIVPSVGDNVSISLAEARQAFFEKYTLDDLMDLGSTARYAPLLMDDLIDSYRFKDLRLSNYVNEIDVENQSQFSAITFSLDDNTDFVAYRGTDHTIAGWKEDCNMSFLENTPGQLKAVEYLNLEADNGRKLFVGGHSKGGNFAVYASVFCKKEVQDRISFVYSNDGPGFRDNVLESEEYKYLLPRIKSTIPEQSVVGLLLGNKYHHMIVSSSAKGLSQHNPMTWQVIRNHFEEVPELSKSSLLIDNTVSNWLAELSEEDREAFIDSVFEPLTANGTLSTDEIKSSVFSSVTGIYKYYKGMPKEQQQLMLEFSKILASEAKDNIVSEVKQGGKLAINYFRSERNNLANSPRE